MSESFIIEAGDNPLPYTHERGPYADWHKYRFNHNGVDYDVDVEHDDNEMEVAFSSGKGDDQQLGVTGSAGAASPRIMGTLHHIITTHVKTHPEIQKVNFTSDNDHKSRVKLYTKYTSRLGGKTYKGAWETYHIIPASSYRKINESEDQPVRIRLGKTKGEQAQKFMVDFADDSDEHPFNPVVVNSLRVFSIAKSSLYVGLPLNICLFPKNRNNWDILSGPIMLF